MFFKRNKGNKQNISPATIYKEESNMAKRWEKKRNNIAALHANIDRLKRRVRVDLDSSNEREMLTACIVRIMLKTSERVGNADSAIAGHFGVTQFRKKHITVTGNTIELSYIGKSGVEHDKSFSDAKVSHILTKQLSKSNQFIFTDSNGTCIPPERVNNYLKEFRITSKDIRGYNSNRIMLNRLKDYNVIEPKQRAKIFNDELKLTAKTIGHKPVTLRTHYLLPEIEEDFYANGKIKTYSNID